MEDKIVRLVEESSDDIAIIIFLKLKRGHYESYNGIVYHENTETFIFNYKSIPDVIAYKTIQFNVMDNLLNLRRTCRVKESF